MPSRHETKGCVRIRMRAFVHPRRPPLSPQVRSLLREEPPDDPLHLFSTTVVVKYSQDCTLFVRPSPILTTVRKATPCTHEFVKRVNCTQFRGIRVLPYQQV